MIVNQPDLGGTVSFKNNLNFIKFEPISKELNQDCYVWHGHKKKKMDKCEDRVGAVYIEDFDNLTRIKKSISST